MSRSRSILSKSLLVAVAVLAPVTALATVPPQPAPTQSSAPPWVGFFFMGVLLAMVLGVSLMPSKRGHQD
ncbi:MAG: hypothetical protein E2O40_05305 [Planctomycetota bacterium]|nr:MAG: hypothetical protein E2O40_05305 [Planctomycetota bacterium]